MKTITLYRITTSHNCHLHMEVSDRRGETPPLLLGPPTPIRVADCQFQAALARLSAGERAERLDRLRVEGWHAWGSGYASRTD